MLRGAIYHLKDKFSIKKIKWLTIFHNNRYFVLALGLIHIEHPVGCDAGEDRQIPTNLDVREGRVKTCLPSQTSWALVVVCHREELYNPAKIGNFGKLYKKIFSTILPFFEHLRYSTLTEGLKNFFIFLYALFSLIKFKWAKLKPEKSCM